MIVGNPFRWADPGTWPWFVYVWLAATVAGFVKPLWRWIQRNRAKSWPITTGQIESASVNEPEPGFMSSTPRRGSRAYVAELGYSYRVVGQVEAGFYKREFYTEEEAQEFLRDLKGKPVTVQYNPNKPSTSIVSEPSIQTLLQTRAPKPVAEIFSSVSTSSVPPLVSRLLWVFVFLSAIGLAVSLWVHLGAVMGRRVAPEALFWTLHMGIFVVWLPAVLVAKARVGNIRRKDFWKVALQGSPDWMRYMVYGFLGYALINFALFMLQAPTGGGGETPPAVVWRGFSGHWMAFYSAALAILYTAAANERGNIQHCVNGHPVPPGANFCVRCGQPVLRA
jgi:CubicO group peptidase (beta-lactamase class C family)